ncbi:MAG TPA: PIN domain-containing protein, partial [Terriglobia bacterium]|nr:PIN domain-containing protein [Terriglobia bacterium]
MGLDTSVFIFQIEENPKYVHLTHQIFTWLQSARNTASTSTITMLEVLVQPYREADEERVDSFYALLSTYPHLEWIDTSLAIADRAAQLRARFNLKAPDAIQAATAIVAGSTG